MVAAGSTRRERWRQAQPLENKNTIWYLCMGCDSPQNNSMASPFWDWIAARWAVRESNPRHRIPTPVSQQNHQATTTELQTKATLVTGSPQNAVFYNKCTPVKEPALQSLSAAHTEASAQAQQKHCGTASAAVAAAASAAAASAAAATAAVAAAASAAAASAPAASAGYCCCCCCCLSPHQSLLRVPRCWPSLGLALSALSGASGAPSAPSTSLALSLPFAAGGESRASPGSKRLAAPAEAPRTKAAMQYLLLCIAVRAAAAAAGERQQQRRQQHGRRRQLTPKLLAHRLPLLALEVDQKGLDHVAASIVTATTAASRTCFDLQEVAWRRPSQCPHRWHRWITVSHRRQ